MRNTNKNLGYIIAPGETIKELLQVNSLTRLELADLLEINREDVDKLINGNEKITPQLSLKLESVFGLPSSFWNNLESNYRKSLNQISVNRI